MKRPAWWWRPVAASRDSLRATAWWRSITSLVPSASTAAAGSMRSAPPTRKSGLPPDSSPPEAASRNTSASWIGSSSAASRRSRTAFLSNAPRWWSPSIPATRPWRSAVIEPEDFVLVLGQGPIGLMFTMLARRMGARVARHRYHRGAPGSRQTLRRRVLLGPAPGGRRRRGQASYRGPRGRYRHRGRFRSGNRGPGHRLLPTRRPHPAFRANLRYGTDRSVGG